jgi:hypothetical protein
MYHRFGILDQEKSGNPAHRCVHIQGLPKPICFEVANNKNFPCRLRGLKVATPNI